MVYCDACVYIYKLQRLKIVNSTDNFNKIHNLLMGNGGSKFICRDESYMSEKIIYIYIYTYSMGIKMYINTENSLSRD